VKLLHRRQFVHLTASTAALPLMSRIAGAPIRRAPAPNGYRLLLAEPANAINATIYQNLNFDFIRDIAPVASNKWANVVTVAGLKADVADRH